MHHNASRKRNGVENVSLPPIQLPIESNIQPNLYSCNNKVAVKVGMICLF